MTRVKEQLEEDRMLRDSARALFRNDLAHVRKEITPRALGERLADKVGAKVDAASDGVVELVRRHGGTIAAGGGALAVSIGLWLARKPILERLRGKRDGTTDGGSDKEADDE
jgi:hypothetical protein